MFRGDEPPLRPGDVESVIARVCFPARDDERNPGRVGLEVERFPIRRAWTGGSAGRVRIDATRGLLSELIGGTLSGAGEHAGLPAFHLTGGGDLTFEPGGQIEHVTAAHDTAAAALAEVEQVAPPLAVAFDAGGVALVGAGVDIWHDPATVPLQLDGFRYEAMDAFLHVRSVSGRVMMRHTCSIQANFDLGPESERADRWLLANLLSPLLTATFANSPGEGVVNARARAWQRLDPTRTGFPAGFVDGAQGDPVSQITAAALGADVMLVRTAPGAADPGPRGWSFAQWMADPPDRYGAPTASDLEYHLTTLFHEVRPRGMLEFRSIDALPAAWRSVPVTLLSGALEDAVARGQLIALLERHRRALPSLWVQGATTGVADPELCALAVETWSYALAGAGRLPAGYLPPRALAVAEAFLERFTLRGGCPASELAAQYRESPLAALAWAEEPVPEGARRRP